MVPVIWNCIAPVECMGAIPGCSRATNAMMLLIILGRGHHECQVAESATTLGRADVFEVFFLEGVDAVLGHSHWVV